MLGNTYQIQNHNQQAQLAMINNANLMYSIQNQFMPNAGFNQPSMANSQPNSHMYMNHSGDMSIYPSQSLGDSSICINSPLPLKPGTPVTTTPSQGRISDINGSNEVTSHSQTQTQMSQTLHVDSEDCPTSSPISGASDNLF